MEIGRRENFVAEPLRALHAPRRQHRAIFQQFGHRMIRARRRTLMVSSVTTSSTAAPSARRDRAPDRRSGASSASPPLDRQPPGTSVCKDLVLCCHRMRIGGTSRTIPSVRPDFGIVSPPSRYQETRRTNRTRSPTTRCSSRSLRTASPTSCSRRTSTSDARPRGYIACAVPAKNSCPSGNGMRRGYTVDAPASSTRFTIAGMRVSSFVA